MFYLILIAAIALLSVGFLAMLLATPLEIFAGKDAKATRILNTVARYCRHYALWTGGFLCCLFVLIWLHGQSFILWLIASVLIGGVLISYLGTLAVAGGIGGMLIVRDMQGAKEKWIVGAYACACLVLGVAGLWHSVRLFFVPVYSAIV